MKQFAPYEKYHVYNRGVAKQPVFLDQQDYDAFIRRLKLSLLPPKEADKLQEGSGRLRLHNFHGDLSLEAFCLMPNHFHMLLSLRDDTTAITKLLTSVSTSYSMYFNKKYERVGPVFQGRYKAAHVTDDAYSMHLTRYIHCNARALGEDIYTYPYSSLKYYFANDQKWLDTADQEGMFASAEEYRKFVNDLVDLQQAEESYQL